MNDSVTLKKEFTFETDRHLSGVCFSPGEDLLMSGGFDGSVRWWKPGEARWEEQDPLVGHHGWVIGPEFSPNGEICVTADSWGAIIAWKRTKLGWEKRWHHAEAHAGWIRQIAISSDGNQIASVSRDQHLKLWKVSNGELLQSKELGTELFSSAFSPDNQSVLAGDLYGQVRQWSVATGKEQRSFDASELYLEHRLQEIGGARQLRFDAHGKRLAVAGTRPKNGGNVQGVPVVLIFDWQTSEKIETVELGATSDVYVTDLSLEGKKTIFATTSGNPGTGQLLGIIPGEEQPFLKDKSLSNCHAFAWSPDRTQLLVTSTNKGSNGNGKRLDANGEYPGNFSQMTMFQVEQKS